MKFKTTRKDVLNGYYKVFRTGYCTLQHLLSREHEIAYTCGTYGWNADIYGFGSIAICTGYRPFGEPIPHDMAKAYDDEARAICEDSSLTLTERKVKLRERIEELLEELMDDAQEVAQ